jgi:hypothetical protein
MSAEGWFLAAWAVTAFVGMVASFANDDAEEYLLVGFLWPLALVTLPLWGPVLLAGLLAACIRRVRTGGWDWSVFDD